MSERKVLNKYYPPNFDPSKIPRKRQPKNAEVFHEVRLMSPFSMRCNACGEYIYKGKKFNAKKTTVEGESYYRIKIYRFYIRCPGCSAEITFKTDPANMDYVAESGAMRNFEPWRDEETVQESHLTQKLIEEELDPIKALENKTLDAKKEMEIAEALDEIRTRNARSEKIDVDQLLHILIQQNNASTSLKPNEVEEKFKEEDEKLAKSIFQSTTSSSSSSKLIQKESSPDLLSTSSFSSTKSVSQDLFNKRKLDNEENWSHLIVVKKAKKPPPPPNLSTTSPNGEMVSSSTTSTLSNTTTITTSTISSSSGLGLAYNSDDESD